MEKKFEYAMRKKLRFAFKGQLSVEDLWDLSVTNLDSIYKDLNSQLKKVTEASLLNTMTAADIEIGIKIDIIKYIVKVKLEEAEARTKAKEKKEQKQKIMEIIAAKKDESLQNKSLEELESMLNNLD